MTRISGVRWLVVAGVLAAMGLGSDAVAAAQPVPGAVAAEGPSIVVTGQGEVSSTPDRAVIQLGVTVQDLTADAAQTKVNERMNAVIEAVKKLGVAPERIQTSRADLYPVYEQMRPNDSRDPQVIAYRSSNSVKVELDDLKKVGAAVDASIKAGANQVNGIGFELKDDTVARKEALTKAVKDARAKAEIIAAALGGSLGAVIEANEGQVMVTPQPFWGRATTRMEFSDLSKSMPVQAGQVQVEASVTLRYAYKAP